MLEQPVRILTESAVGRRTVSNVPAQALTMLNNPFVISQARLWADRLFEERLDDASARIRRLYEMAFGRPPGGSELSAAMDFLARHGVEYNGSDDSRTWADLCHVLLNVREFIFIR